MNAKKDVTKHQQLQAHVLYGNSMTPIVLLRQHSTLEDRPEPKLDCVHANYFRICSGSCVSGTIQEWCTQNQICAKRFFHAFSDTF